MGHRKTEPPGPAGTIDAIPVPEGLPDDAREAFRMGARAGLDEGFKRGSSAGRHSGKEDYWRKP